MPNPPETAQLLLHALLPVEARESVAGDLLEEYRDSRVPASGEFRADVWYWRQVGDIWLRAYWWLVAPVVFLLVVGDDFKTWRAPSGASYMDGLPALARVAMSPAGLVALLGLANAYGSWRTRRWKGGLVASLGVSVIVWVFMVVWSNVTFDSFAQVAQSSPHWIEAWHWSVQHGHAAPGETFRHWLYWDIVGSQIIAGFVLLVAPCVYSAVGAIAGEFISHWQPRSSRS